MDTFHIRASKFSEPCREWQWGFHFTELRKNGRMDGLQNDKRKEGEIQNCHIREDFARAGSRSPEMNGRSCK